MGQNLDNAQKAKIAFAGVALVVGVFLILLQFGVIPNPFASKPQPPQITEQQKKDFEKQEKKMEEEAKTRPPSGA